MHNASEDSSTDTPMSVQSKSQFLAGRPLVSSKKALFMALTLPKAVGSELLCKDPGEHAQPKQGRVSIQGCSGNSFWWYSLGKMRGFAWSQ